MELCRAVALLLGRLHEARGQEVLRCPALRQTLHEEALLEGEEKTHTHTHPQTHAGRKHVWYMAKWSAARHATQVQRHRKHASSPCDTALEPAKTQECLGICVCVCSFACVPVHVSASESVSRSAASLYPSLLLPLFLVSSEHS